MLAIVAAVLIAAAPPQDTIFTSDGGRVVGTVVEEGPNGVAVQLPDGTTRRFPRREVVRIEYADGSVSKLSDAPAPPRSAPPPAYTPPPPGYVPPPPPPYGPPPPYAYRPPPPYGPPPPPPSPRTGPLAPVYLSFGLGGLFPEGEAESGVGIHRVLESQFNLQFEGGARLNPHVALGLYADLGWGDPGSDLRASCNANLIGCDASTGRFGLLLRTTFAPAASFTPWLSVGTGFEYGSVYTHDFGGGSTDVLSYNGWEMVRLQGGMDFRGNGVVGVGFYGGFSLGRYYDVHDITVGTVSISNKAYHTMFEAGIRFTLFP
jgi:hypothetical protein